MGIMKNCKKLLSVIVTLLLAASLLTSSAFAISGEAFIATPGEVNLPPRRARPFTFSATPATAGTR